uniref:Uncharacterized protein n=1 Tax=Arundo donax TaxID=35708 RepID=A0A0A9GF41_ARUDO
MFPPPPAANLRRTWKTPVAAAPGAEETAAAKTKRTRSAAPGAMAAAVGRSIIRGGRMAATQSRWIRDDDRCARPPPHRGLGGVDWRGGEGRRRKGKQSEAPER